MLAQIPMTCVGSGPPLSNTARLMLVICYGRYYWREGYSTRRGKDVGFFPKVIEPIFTQGSKKTTKDYERLDQRAQHVFGPTTFHQPAFKARCIKPLMHYS